MTETTERPGAKIGEHVLVRTYSAGVHMGQLSFKEGTGVVLNNARRLWAWRGAFTLHEVASKGVSKSGSRISTTIPTIELTEAIEIIPTSEEARASYELVHE
jgi:hypothetical protein